VRRRRALAHYFEGQPLLTGTQPNRRKLAEQLAQEAAGELPEDLRRMVTNFSFLEQKIAYQRTAVVLADLSPALPGRRYCAMWRRRCV
jgi:hypothetical protein